MTRYTPPTLQWCVQNSGDWPCWPCLPIKNKTGIEPGHFPRFGVLVDCGKEGVRFLDETNICDSEAIKAKLDAAPVADIAALEAAGWVVD